MHTKVDALKLYVLYGAMKNQSLICQDALKIYILSYSEYSNMHFPLLFREMQGREERQDADDILRVLKVSKAAATRGRGEKDSHASASRRF